MAYRRTVVSAAAASPFPHGHRRVVVTGIGAISPLGETFSSTWKTLTSRNDSGNDNNSDKDVGITSLEEALECQNLPSDILGRDISLSKQLPSQVAAPVQASIPYDPRTSRFVQLALLAGEEAARTAGLMTWLGIDIETTSNSNSNANSKQTFQSRRERTGSCIASGMSSIREILSAHHTLHTKSLRRLSPHFVPKVLTNSPAARLSLHLSLLGPNHAASTACAAGAHAIGDAMRFIQCGDADVMFAGGTESCIDPLSMAGFCRLKALSTGFNDCPSLSSRPFDRRRDGFVMAEGAAVLVLEEMEHALRRGANILCELSGYAATGDGYHVTSPDPEGKGAERAMTMALQKSFSCFHGADAATATTTAAYSMVDYVNAHATSTPVGDEIESKVIDRVFMDQSDGRERDLFVSSTKGATGHLLGAAGALEAAFSVMSIVDQTIPPTKNLSFDTNTNERQKDDDIRFRYVMDNALDVPVDVVVSNSFGFGGTNACLVFSKFNPDR